MFILNRNDTAPLYKQLYNQIREHALSGETVRKFQTPVRQGFGSRTFDQSEHG